MVLICISLMTNDIKHLFMCLLAVCIFGEMSIQIPCPVLNWVVFLLLLEYFIYFEYWTFIKCIICRCFLPSCGLSFHFLNSILWSTKIFNCGFKLNFIFSLVACAFGVIFKKPLPAHNCYWTCGIENTNKCVFLRKRERNHCQISVLFEDFYSFGACI